MKEEKRRKRAQTSPKLEELEKFRPFTNRIKEMIEGVADSPDIVRTRNFPGTSFYSFLDMILYDKAQRKKLRENKSQYLEEFGLTQKDLTEESTIEIALFIVVNIEGKQEEEYLFKSINYVSEFMLKKIKELHESQEELLWFEIITKFLEQETVKSKPFKVKPKFLYPDNYYYKWQKVRRYWGNEIETILEEKVFRRINYRDVLAMKNAAREYHFPKVEQILGNGASTEELFKKPSYEICQLQLVEKNDEKEIIHPVLSNYVVEHMAPVIENEFMKLPMLYDLAWQEAKESYGRAQKKPFQPKQ